MPDDLTTVADDWEVCFLGGAAFAYGGGAGMYFAVFRSEKAKALEPFYLTTAGVGLGGNATGFDLSQRNGLTYTKLEVMTPFSVTMLHTSAGLLLSASAGISIGKAGGVNYGYTYFDAGRNGATFFKTGGTGKSAGSGVGAIAFTGLWYSHKLNNDSANPITAYEKSFVDSLKEITGTIEQGIRNLYGVP